MAATTVTTSAISASAAATNPKPPPQKTIHPQFLKIKSLTATIAATAILTTTPFPSLASEPSSSSSYTLYYGTAASAANYGGYGGKVEKGTNGTDSEFFNPKKKTEKEYLTFLSGFRTLAPRDAIDGVGKHSLIKVTCARNKLYAHFVIAPAVEWDRDQDTLRHLHQSFKTVG
ncbi:Thylakoid lumenal 19 kDa protein, chloroplastic [Linum grandiflorum]